MCVLEINWNFQFIYLTLLLTLILKILYQNKWRKMSEWETAHLCSPEQQSLRRRQVGRQVSIDVYWNCINSC